MAIRTESDGPMSRPSDSKISVIEKIRELEAEKARLLDSAKEEALAKANNAIDELRELGFEYRLVEGSGSSARRKPASTGSDGGKGTRPIAEGKICPICEFATEPPHDARKHRSQGGNKRPFTDQELLAMHMHKA